MPVCGAHHLASVERHVLVQGLLGQCLEMSRQITLKLYEKPLMTPHSYIKFYQSCNTRLNQEQLSALAALFSWRDRKCRTLDDSPGRLLPKRLLLTLSQQMPVDVPGVLRIAGRHKLLIQHANEVRPWQPRALSASDGGARSVVLCSNVSGRDIFCNDLYCSAMHSGRTGG